MTRAEALAAWGLPGWEDEVKGLIPGRRHVIDCAHKGLRIALELQGGVWSRGKHGRGSGIVKDYEKANLLAIEGFLTLQFTPEEFWKGYATETIKKAMKSRGWKGK